MIRASGSSSHLGGESSGGPDPALAVFSFEAKGRGSVHGADADIVGTTN
jgi:hypothetical protein